MQLTIVVGHDEAEGVWFVQESDVPGLNAEAPSLDALLEIIVDLAPDLVAANLPHLNLDQTAPIPLRVQHVMNTRPLNAA